MAAPLFLSYTWDEPSFADAEMLDTYLRHRGVPIWRDRRGMRWGAYNRETVIRTIAGECSGFALLYTKPVLESEFVCDVELPAMARRRRRDEKFFAGAVFRSQSINHAAAALRERAGVELQEPLGTVVRDESRNDDLRSAARAILQAYIRAQYAGGPVTLRMETRDPLPTEADELLHLAWAPPLVHDADGYEPVVWGEQFAPALHDMRAALQHCGTDRVLRIGGNMHLSAALALGYEFREPTGWGLELNHPRLACKSAIDEPDLNGWRAVRSPGGGAVSPTLVVCVHASKDVDAAVARHCEGESVSPTIRLDVFPPEGQEPGRAIVEPAQANAIAAAIVEQILAIRRDYEVVRSYLYLACPWPLAALIGWHLGSAGEVICHEAAATRDTYRTSCVLV